MMKVKAIKSFRDKVTKEAIRVGREIEITEERFGELTAGPLGIFVEEIKEEQPIEPPNKVDEESKKDKKKSTKK